MFRTLQSSPSTITIFHSNKIALLNKLYGILDKAATRINTEEAKIHIDVMANTIPTFDQYDTIAHTCLKDNYSKNALATCFPFLGGKKEYKIGQDRTTINSPMILGHSSNGLKLFNEAEYAKIVDVFLQLQDARDSEVDPSEVFLPPLVVDWDQSLIANDEFGVNTILKQYLK